MDEFMNDNLYFLSSYGSTFKEPLQLRNKLCKEHHEKFSKELSVEVCRRCQLSKCIKKLPKDIQVKIYIFATKNYNKYHVPETARQPMHYEYSKYISNEIYKVYHYNIHFLHLDCNTLPENKTWIIGCQCGFCKKASYNKEVEYDKFDKDPYTYFLDNVHCRDTLDTGDPCNPWNASQDLWGGMRIFDPSFNEYSLDKLIVNKGIKLDFSYDTYSAYSSYTPPQDLPFATKI